VPLAQDLIEQNPCSNPGLALTRLAPQKNEWSQYLSGMLEATACGYVDAFERMRARTVAGPDYRRVLLATSLEPVVCGMGERTPGENGLTLHPVYGVPYLPGTSLKGILRAWVLSQAWGAEWQESGEQFRALFGQGGHDGAAAVVDILDALPVPGSHMLTMDVLTPHHKQYYEGEGEPLGWEKPVPIQFLAASKGVEYRVVIEGDPAWVEKAAEWLALALAERGIGGKTRAGYGRFECQRLEESHPKEHAAAERNLKARRSKVEQLLIELEERPKEELIRGIEEWLLSGDVRGPIGELLSVAPERAPHELRRIGVEFDVRTMWSNRVTNKNADEKKKARARALIEAWDKLFPAEGRP
jgi:CRISPR type III-B/RAMP module RAMP protein Cmr6